MLEPVEKVFVGERLEGFMRGRGLGLAFLNVMILCLDMGFIFSVW